MMVRAVCWNRKHITYGILKMTDRDINAGRRLVRVRIVHERGDEPILETKQTILAVVVVGLVDRLGEERVPREVGRGRDRRPTVFHLLHESLCRSCWSEGREAEPAPVPPQW